jgi:hypothetical protein
MKQFFVYALILFAGLTSVLGGYNCRTPTDCSVYCSNVEPYLVDSLKDTPWITVPWSDGSCYFHNTETRENTDEYPLSQVQ